MKSGWRAGLAAVVLFASSPAGANMAPPMDEYKLGLTLETARIGARVLTVEPGTPADRAGLKPGDVLLSIDRRYVRSFTKTEIKTFASETHAWPVEVIYVRGGRDVLQARIKP